MGVPRKSITAMKGPRRSYGANGFSLIELLVSITLVVIGLGSLSVLFLAAYQTNQKAQHIDTATQAAQLLIERARQMSFAEITGSNPLLASGTANTVNDPEFVSAAATLPSWQRTITIAPYPYPASSNLKQVTVELQWGGARKSRGQLKVATLIANRG